MFFVFPLFSCFFCVLVSSRRIENEYFKQRWKEQRQSCHKQRKRIGFLFFLLFFIVFITTRSKHPRTPRSSKHFFLFDSRNEDYSGLLSWRKRKHQLFFRYDNKREQHFSDNDDNHDDGNSNNRKYAQSLLQHQCSRFLFNFEWRRSSIFLQ